MSIKYAFANCNGNPVHIDDITEDIRSKNTFTCICCNDRMVAHIKGKKKHHFQHFENVEHDNETYLHMAAKAIFKDTYINALQNKTPIHIDYSENITCNAHFDITNFVCDMGKDHLQHDITKQFTFLEEEVYVGKLKPDIVLKTANNQHIFIEFHVKHKCSEDKLKSGNRIIELTIKNETDLAELRKQSALKKGKQVRYYNFKTKDKLIDTCSNNGCRTLVDYVLVYKDNSYKIGSDPVEYLLQDIFEDKVLDYAMVRDRHFANEYYKYRDLLEALQTKRIFVRNCVNCLYHKPNDDLHSNKFVYCDMKKKGVAPDEAHLCYRFANLMEDDDE